MRSNCTEIVGALSELSGLQNILTPAIFKNASVSGSKMVMTVAAKVVLNFCSLQLLLREHCWRNIFSWSLSRAPASFTTCADISQDRCAGKELKAQSSQGWRPLSEKRPPKFLIWGRRQESLWRSSSFLKVFKETLSRDNIKNAWVGWERKNSYLCIKLHMETMSKIPEKKSLCVSVFLSYDSMCLVLRLIPFRSQS